jgi:fatty acid desaturase
MAPSIEGVEGRGELGLSRAGLNQGTVSKELYVAARMTVVAKEAEIAELKEAEAKAGEEPTAAGAATRSKVKLNSNHHYLHGKVYDLRPFYASHPGGSNILEMTAGEIDCTPSFESYHAFANLPSIMSQLAKYQVTEPALLEGAPEAMYLFEEDGFYKTVTRRVRAHFGSDLAKQSVATRTKTSYFGFGKIAVQLSLYSFFYYHAFLRPAPLPLPVSMASAFLAAMFLINWGFTAMHDASHFALGAKDHWLNSTVCRLWCALASWNCQSWMHHHAVRHHAYTGSDDLDPDVQHALPLIRKSPAFERSRAHRWMVTLGDSLPGMSGWMLGAIIFYTLLPGMWAGQALMYGFYRLNKYLRSPLTLISLADTGALWGMKESFSLKGYETTWWETVVFFAMFAVQLWRANPAVTYSFMVGMNVFYSMCIVADHDLVESALTNHVDVAAPKAKQEGQEPQAKVDWGEVQVRNSTDFLEHSWFFTHMFGGINQQIEHHLFPSMAGEHLRSIAPIVQRTCEEFGVPYTTYPRIQDAWWSFLMVFRAVMTGEDIDADFQKKTL